MSTTCSRQRRWKDSGVEWQQRTSAHGKSRRKRAHVMSGSRSPGECYGVLQRCAPATLCNVSGSSPEGCAAVVSTCLPRAAAGACARCSSCGAAQQKWEAASAAAGAKRPFGTAAAGERGSVRAARRTRSVAFLALMFLAAAGSGGSPERQRTSVRGRQRAPARQRVPARGSGNDGSSEEPQPLQGTDKGSVNRPAEPPAWRHGAQGMHNVPPSSGRKARTAGRELDSKSPQAHSW